MSETTTAEETAKWQRRFASQANNRAWALSEARSRTPDEDDEMLQAAHTAMYLWGFVGNAKNHAHAAQLVAHVYALLRLAEPARHYLAKAQPVFFGSESAGWELALAHAVAANVAAASGEPDVHRTHYLEAQRLIAELPDPEDRGILNATLRVVPAPADGSRTT